MWSVRGRTPSPQQLPADGRLLLEVLNGDPAPSIRDDEARRVLEPVLSGWERDVLPGPGGQPG
ncbi:hypothetical protein [Kitasatospora sp. NPDC093102]|uniref:hypothetical protein n=1 Tax=Kitasatospora sp. NPDC093102 TaxID=3155069 RepID=UPI003439126E